MLGHGFLFEGHIEEGDLLLTFSEENSILEQMEERGTKPFAHDGTSSP
jgi:hypothetical protein